MHAFCLRIRCDGSPASLQAAGSNEAAEVADAQAQATQQVQHTAVTPDEARQYLYEPKFGLPVVRKRLSYGELLREIRIGNVKQLKFFQSYDEAIELEGPCLVVFKDDTLAQGYVPHFDYRIPYAMENHGVAAVRLPGEPAPGTFSVQKMWTENQQQIVLNVMPVIAIGIVYYATQLAAKWKVTCNTLSTQLHVYQMIISALLCLLNQGTTQCMVTASTFVMSHKLVINCASAS